MSWDLAYAIATAAQSSWMVSFAAYRLLKSSGRDIPGWVRWLYFEGRPLVPLLLPGVYLVGGVAAGTEGIGWRLASLLCGFANWWMSRRDKDDDDRWKRRREALSAKVAEVAGRLQVVPAGGDSR